MQQASSDGVGARPARSLAVALLLGSAAVVGLVCLTKGESVMPSAPGAAVLPVFPLLEEAAALQVRPSANLDRRSAIAAGFGVAAASVAAPAHAKKTEDLSPYSKVDPKAFGGGRTMGKDFKTPKGGEGILWKGPKQGTGKIAKGKPDAGVYLNSTEDALALIKNSGARTFKDLAEGTQSGGGWQDHMDATRKQTERLYAERAAKRKGA